MPIQRTLHTGKKEILLPGQVIDDNSGDMFISTGQGYAIQSKEYQLRRPALQITPADKPILLRNTLGIIEAIDISHINDGVPLVRTGK